MVNREYLKVPGYVDNRPTTMATIREYLNKRGSMKYAFGLPLDQTLPRYSLPVYNDLYYIHDSRIGLMEAATVADLSKGKDDDAQPFVSLFEGIGNTAWCFASTIGDKGHLLAVEMDRLTYKLAQSNIQQAGVDGRVTALNMDAFYFLGHSQSSEVKYRAVFMDPPWPFNARTLNYLSLSDVNPRLEELVDLSISVAPVVAFHLPPTFPLEPIQDLSERVNRRAIVHIYGLKDSPEFKTKTIYLVQGDNGFIANNMTLSGENPSWVREDIL